MKKTLLALVLLAVSAANLVVWFIHAPPLLSLGGTAYAGHPSHEVILFVHIVGFTLALFVGPIGLWTGLNNIAILWHRWLGRIYLVGGAVGAIGGLVLSCVARHDPLSLYVSTFVLSLLWLAAAFMAYRAIRNRRISSHREWMIRSYVVTFTFVACRVAMRYSLFDYLGNEGYTATVWVMWVVPVLATEFALQWPKGSAKR